MGWLLPFPRPNSIEPEPDRSRSTFDAELLHEVFGEFSRARGTVETMQAARSWVVEGSHVAQAGADGYYVDRSGTASFTTTSPGGGAAPASPVQAAPQTVTGTDRASVLAAAQKAIDNSLLLRP
jgi:hypothetical protein